MARRQNDSESSRFSSLTLLFLGFISCGVVYTVLSLLNPNSIFSNYGTRSSALAVAEEENYDGNGGGCCRGIENLELWGTAVKWGSEFKFNSSRECCQACKAMCNGSDGPCLCDSWVFFCGNREICGSKFGECWLKKQKDIFAPDQQEAGHKVSWTSGLVFGKGEGIIGLETKYGTLHIKLFPECAPHSVAYILELIALRHCAGCEFFRAENRSQFWDSERKPHKKGSFWTSFCVDSRNIGSSRNSIHENPQRSLPKDEKGFSCMGWFWTRIYDKPS